MHATQSRVPENRLCDRVTLILACARARVLSAYVIGSIKQTHGNSVYLSIHLSIFRCVKRSCMQGACNKLAAKTISDALAEATKGITRFQSYQHSCVYTCRSSACQFLQPATANHNASIVALMQLHSVICRSSVDRAWWETSRLSKLNFHTCLVSKINYRSDLIVRTSLCIHRDLRNVSPLLLSNSFQISFRRKRERERNRCDRFIPLGHTWSVSDYLSSIRYSRTLQYRFNSYMS